MSFCGIKEVQYLKGGEGRVKARSCRFFGFLLYDEVSSSVGSEGSDDAGGID